MSAAPRRVRPAPPSGRPLISVVIPCHNYRRYVSYAIDSVLSQRGVEVQVIVVDDASTDGSADAVAAIAAQDERVVLVRHTENLGAVRTFNDGLVHADGEYLVRLDADDLLTPGSLARAAALATAFPSVGLVYGHPLHFTDTLPSARLHARRWLIWPGRQWLEGRCRSGVNVITSPEALMRRSVVDAVGGQRDLAHTHDMEMWMRIAAVSDIAFVAGADQAWHREHEGSLSQEIDAGLGDIEDRRDAFETLFEWTAERLPDTARLRTLAARALADEAYRAVTHMHDRNRVDDDARDRYLAFAETTDPGAATGRAGRLAAASVSAGRRRPGVRQLVRAIIGRLRRDASFARWRRTGVYSTEG